MRKLTSALLPAAFALSLALATAAIAGPPGGGPGKNGDGDGHGGGGHSKNGGGDGHGGGGGGGGGGSNFGSGNGHIRSFKCVLNGYTVYVPVRGECRKLKRAIAGGSYGGEGHGYVSGGVSVHGGAHVSGGAYAYGGSYGHYQQQRVIRYYSPASPAARQQAEKRARKAARIQADAYYSTGGYGDGVVIGGGYGGGYVYDDQQVIVRKHRKHKRKHAHRVVIQRPAHVYGGEYSYDDDQPVLTKGGGY